jgi:ATP-dependent RNA helicase DDX31/DBP7
MIFVATCDETDYFEFLFQNLKYEATNDTEEPKKLIENEIYKLHGKVMQKIRTDTYLKFKKSKNGILICTDVASRGLDFEDVKLIVQLDPPASVVDYVNRIGRTARIDNYGMSLMFLTYTELKFLDKLKSKAITVDRYDEEEHNYLNYFERKLKKEYEDDRDAHSYINDLIRQFLATDNDYHLKARRAYVSYLRSYGRMKDKDVFHIKKLNLKHLARSFGLGTVLSKGKDTEKWGYNQTDPTNMEATFSKLKENHPARGRKVTRARVIEKMEFL